MVRPMTINLIYIRAAIEANTGVRLSLERTREYLVEEGLITQRQADEEAGLFRGYGECYNEDLASSLIREDPQAVKEEHD